MLFNGVISNGPGSVWFGLVRNRSDFDSSGSVNRKRFATKVNRAREQAYFGSIWRNVFVCGGLGRKITVIKYVM